MTDVSVTKADLTDPVTAGSGTGNLTYTVTVTNDGPATATGVEITEDLNLPSGVTIESFTPSQGAYAPPNDPDGTWTVGTLASGQSETLTITLTVGSSTAAGTDVIDNTATLTGLNEPDADDTDDSATEATSVQRQIDLVITKDDQTAEPVQPGETITYELAYQNEGPSDATGVTLTETVPANTTFDAANSDGGWMCTPDGSAGSTCTLDVGILAGGSPGPFTVDFAVTVTGTTSAITNTVSIQDEGTNGDDLNPADNTATERTPQVPLRQRPVDIAITKTLLALGDIEAGFDDSDDFDDFADTVGLDDGDGLYPELGEVVVFEVEAEHLQGTLATLIEVEDVLGTNGTVVMIFDADESDLGAFNGQYNPTTESWTVLIGPGEVKRFWLAVRLTHTASLTNTATLVDSRQPDNNGSNNTDDATANPLLADLQLEKDVVSFQNLENDGIEAVFSLTVTNHGPSTAPDVVVTDIVLSGVAITCLDDDDLFPCTGFTGGVWTIGTLGSGDSATLLVQVVGPDEVLDNVATVSSSLADPNTSNNVSGARAETGRPEPGRPFQADLSLTKEGSVTSAEVGDELVYTLVVSNSGPNTTNNVEVTDLLPAGVTFVSADPDEAYLTGLWAIGQLKAGASDTLRITVEVVAAGTITNVAMVSNATLPDPDSEFGFDFGEGPNEDDEDEATVEVTQGAVARGVDSGASSPSPSVPSMPDTVELGKNYPNPFNPETVIPFGVPEAMQVTVEVYDLLGRRVALLVDGRLEAGRYEARFRAEQLPTGIYLVRLAAGSVVETQRVTLMK